MTRSKLVMWIATVVALYHIVVAGSFLSWFGFFMPAQIHRSISLVSALILIFVLVRAGKNQDRRMPWYDYLLMFSSIIGLGYVIFFYDEMIQYGVYGFLDTKGVVLSLMICIPVLEAVRRKTGIIFPCIILFFVGITLFQKYLPGILYGQGYPLDRLLYSSFVGTSGIFGLPLGVASTILIIFLIFGAFFEASGAGKWFMEIAMSLTGWSRGGPAKASVLSSALFGSISGSPSANVATTGVLTIPMMKNVGYKPAFAGGVEAVASTGGQILPPVMGAIVFVMAEWIGVRYADIAIAALVPALLYFLIVFVSVHLQAHKTGIKALPRKELPSFWPVFVKGWFYLVPLVVLIYFLIFAGYPPQIAGIISLPFIVACSFLSKDRNDWLVPKKIMEAFDSSVKSWLTIVAVTGAVGIMVGALELSGLGLKFSSFILGVSAGNLYLTLLFVGIASLILGMGLDSIPAYVTLATLLVPALIELGIPDVAAHLYVIYWGLSSFITPPVCIAVYVACGISGSKVWETGWEAMKLGVASFLIPFAFVLSPGLLLRDTTGNVIIDILTAIIGSVLVACAIRGYALTDLKAWERAVFGIAGVLFIGPGIYLPVTGLILAAIVLLLQLKSVGGSRNSIQSGGTVN